MRAILAVVSAAAVALGALVAPGAAAAAAQPALRLHGAQYDSPGSDTRSASSLNAEWVSLVNTGASAVNLRGWTIRDKANHVYTFPSVSIAGKGGRIWLHTGKGTTKTPNAYWGSGNYVWNNTGDTAYLRKPSGAAHDSCSWTTKKNRTWVAC